MLVVILFACSTSNTKKSITNIDSAEITSDTAIDMVTQEDTGPTDTGITQPALCPENMVLINDKFCIDPYEASIEDMNGGAWTAHSPFHTPSGNQFRAISKAGVVPQAHISGELAQQACTRSNKRLCSSEEWLLACQGAESRQFPYGSTYQSGACNDVYADGHPLIHYYGTSDGIWDSAHMNDPNINQQPNSLATTASFSTCVTPEGVYDLHGNIHEWVSDENGVFRGGFYADAAINGTGCQYRTTAHHFSYYDYSTGFRCCADRIE